MDRHRRHSQQVTSTTVPVLLLDMNLLKSSDQLQSRCYPVANPASQVQLPPPLVPVELFPNNQGPSEVNLPPAEGPDLLAMTLSTQDVADPPASSVLASPTGSPTAKKVHLTFDFLFTMIGTTRIFIGMNVVGSTLGLKQAMKGEGPHAFPLPLDAWLTAPFIGSSLVNTQLYSATFNFPGTHIIPANVARHATGTYIYLLEAQSTLLL